MNPDQVTAEVQASRRDFMKLGLFGSLAFTTLGSGSLTGCATTPAPFYDQQQKKQYLFLTDSDVPMLEALVPVILAGSLPEDKQARDMEVLLVIDYLDRGIDSFGEPNHAEIRQLFDLLTFAPTRVLAAGMWSSWENASPERIDEFLNGWRNSSIGLFNNAYGALVKMVALVDYGMSPNWSRSGYMGPPAYAIEVLPQFHKEA